jgi:hypothetical protein
MKDKGEEKGVMIILVLIFLLSIFMILVVNSPVRITGYATSASTVSNVTIAKYLSISVSQNLSSGILFGTVNSLPAIDQNASHNYDGASYGTSMYVNLSSDSNTKVDFCVGANSDLTDSINANRLGVGNETYSNATTTDTITPLLINQYPLNTSYVKAGANVSQGESIYYRFWLDIPSGTSSGTYNNSINFKGVEVATACGT